MSLLRRVRRAFETRSRPQLDGRSLFGAQGEAYVDKLLDGPTIVSKVINPIIPLSSQRPHPLESDVLVYTQGNLFCLEIKRLKGRIFYAPASSDDPRFRGRYASETPGIETRVMLRQKIDRSGRYVQAEPIGNLYGKITSFCGQLKHYLGDHVDARFHRLWITAVLVFVQEADTDISAIHDRKAGILYTHELFDFFQEHANPTFARQPSRWVTQGLQQVPTTDLILTTDDQPFKGSLIGHTLTCKTTAGAIMQVPYNSTRSIWFERDGLFSDYDRMTLYDTHGQFREYACAEGEVAMKSLGGERQIHKLRNVRRIVVGEANKKLQQK